MKHSRNYRSSTFAFWSALILISICCFLQSISGSLIVDVNKNFNTFNPCYFDEQDSPSGYCSCNVDLSELEEVNCGFHMNPSEREWQAISLFSTVTFLNFGNRPAGAIKELPPPYVFTELKKLNYFIVKNAMIQTISSFAFGNSSSISEITLKLNQVTTLNEYAFANLANLTKINLSENMIKEINRKVFVNLPKAKELLLSKNEIQTIHDNAFIGLWNLEELTLQDNQISVISREVFSELQKLKRLELQGNQIEYIGDHVFAEMPNLQDLDLHKNKILSLSPSAFAGIKKLTRLNLKGNKITNLYPETFKHLNEIYFLDLRSNELETLKLSVMKPIYKNLKHVNMQLLVDGNRFLCDGGILWMKSLYNETESIYVQSALSGVTCNLFDDSSKHHGVSSTTLVHNEGYNSDLTQLSSPEDTTASSSFNRVVNILNLTASDFGSADASNINHHEMLLPGHDTTYSYHHFSERNEEGSIALPANQRDFRPSEFSSDEMSFDKNHILNEPQATAALEGTGTTGHLPQGTTSADKKIDTSRITQESPSSSSSKIVCDFLTLLVIAMLSVSYRPFHILL